ncbi:MAG: sugar transporter permease, partial [Thermomicrobiales bacterium]|nr:sugar transporter permease [Thermomicrobiales bacterium]
MAVAQLAKDVRAFRPARVGSRTRAQTLWGYALIAPMMAGFAVFFLFALVASLALSLTDWDVLAPPQWVGVDNYARLLHDDAFMTALRNT